jgi:hypothetical protein
MWIKAVIPCLINHHSIKTHEREEMPDKRLRSLFVFGLDADVFIEVFRNMPQFFQANIGIAI